ncbi:hypothetical protein BN7_4921 [Wickerhamomyces ciferrii]|uniref:Chromatin modification-related protein EAF6 n=1 Tax=Wickerhamomyces ciferrii (strain ATCC 14091 / BCRC 22168 / CBS 111 / JCM 3599 / NBRC 0793 / NRRL Y-1031 F-60-10) TaxID=1206466 RepID=K0KV80_WICCF|nr:uncharacterized protein BN7_4921 [Wickerhamomyces ciferrii]CCH45339.1 hypothetical protein BN7_4921 [Wickerhamomyces ciferrii]
MATDSLKEYEKLKKQLQQAILKKKSLDKQITQIEEDIFQKETMYLSESHNSNIVRGFESLNKLNQSSNVNKKKLVFTDDDRVFSLSSHTFVRHLQKKNELDEDDDDSNEGTPVASASSTTKKRKRAEE